MIDREKVISGLQHCVGGRGCYDCPYTDCDSCTPFCKAQNMRDALELLKAQEEKVVNLTTKIAELTTSQEPVEPTEPDEDNMRYCGACGSPVGYEVLEAPGIEYVQYNYCPVCGQAVKWE